MNEQIYTQNSRLTVCGLIWQLFAITKDDCLILANRSSWFRAKSCWIPQMINQCVYLYKCRMFANSKSWTWQTDLLFTNYNCTVTNKKFICSSSLKTLSAYFSLVYGSFLQLVLVMYIVKYIVTINIYYMRTCSLLLASFHFVENCYCCVAEVANYTRNMTERKCSHTIMQKKRYGRWQE